MFRPNVKLVLEPGAGARIVDDLNRRTLTLTPTEGRLLALVVPGSTAETLAAAAKGAGIDIEPKQVEALLQRLHSNELIDYTPSPAAKLAQATLLPDDKVPAFRTDLGVAAAPKPGLMLVTDKQRDRSFTLYDFEVHIARLLDGRHTVAEVIEAAGKIGIPMTPESLSKFIGQMKAYGFVVEGMVVAPAQSDPTWPARNTWSPEIRELYQSALRQFRQGRPGHALEYIDALLEIQPDTPEAISLKQRVEQHLDSGPVTEVSFEDLHGVEEPMPALVAASEPLTGGSGQHHALDLPKPSAPKGPVWNPPAKTIETPAVDAPKPSAPKPTSLLEPEPLSIPVGPKPWQVPITARKTGEHAALGSTAPRKTGEVPALGLEPSRKTGEQPAASSPWTTGEHTVLETSRKTGEQPAATSPWTTGEHTALEPARATGQQPALGTEATRETGKQAAIPRSPTVEEQVLTDPTVIATAPQSSPPKTRAPIFPPKSPFKPAEAKPPASAPSPAPPSEPPVLHETKPLPPVLDEVKPAGDASPREPIFPPRTGEVPAVKEAPFAKTVISRPSSPLPAPAPDSEILQVRASAPPPDRTAFAKTVISRPSAPIPPPAEQPFEDEPAEERQTAVIRPSAPKPEAPVEPPRETTPETPAAATSPLESGPTEVMSESEPVLPPMPERTVVGPPPQRPAPAAETEEAEKPKPPRASAPRRTTGRTPKQQPAEETPPKRTPFIIGGAVVLLVALAFPIPAVQKLDVQLVQTPKAQPKMPGGVFGKLEVQSGARVDQGTVIATLDVSKQKAEKDELAKTAARLDAAAAKELSRANPALLAKARQGVAKARADLAKAKAGLARAKDRSKAELDVSRKEAALERAERFAEAADHGTKAKLLKQEATATKDKMTKLQARIDGAVVTAPASGVFELEALPPAGAQFDEGTPFGRIVEQALVVKGAPDDAKDAVLIYGDKRVPLFSVDKSAHGLTVPFEGGVKPGPAVLEVSKGYRPWPMVVLAR